MKKPSGPRPINLPYASTVASYFGDQGAAMGSSFIGRMFRQSGGGGTGSSASPTGGAPAVKTQVQPPNPRRR